jgi:non-homologous end joining protein Ku
VVDLLDALRKSLKTSTGETPKRARTPQKKAS